MDERSLYIEKIKLMAAKVRSARDRANPTLRYHPLAGAVYWSDEFCHTSDDIEETIMRCVLRYRTSMILGTPEEELKGFWDAWRENFPDWVGLSPDRTTADPEIIAFYNEHNRRCAQRLMESPDRMKESD